MTMDGVSLTPMKSTSPMYTVLQMQDLSEDEAGAAGDDSEDERRHAAMLADVRAAGGANRKRKRRDVLISEAYPESEYNLNPAAASGGGAPL
jgi:U3 small nucleolar RNA-associated protein 14